jgi:hypothetical protein
LALRLLLVTKGIGPADVASQAFSSMDRTGEMINPSYLEALQRNEYLSLSTFKDLTIIIIPIGTKMIYEIYGENHYILKHVSLCEGRGNFFDWNIIKKRHPISGKVEVYSYITGLFT